MGQLLTTKELAKYLKLTEVTKYKYVKEGMIPIPRIGSSWRFDKDQIGELLRKGKEGTQQRISAGFWVRQNYPCSIAEDFKIEKFNRPGWRIRR